MILYHTSDKTIRHPDLAFSRAYLDFGKGFYTTPIRRQAEKYGRRFFKEGRKAYLNVYELDDELSGYTDISRTEAIKRLRKKKPNWQICLCNQNLIDLHLHFVESIALSNDES